MGRRDLTQAFLWIPRCRSIHTCFMKGPIDVLFLDRRRSVVSRHAALQPWRLLAARRPADSVLELPAGWIAAHSIVEGDLIEW
ncbi:MAG TPA: DUF192 domain-containing protein [Thermoanaerobaculia bacterium]|nr:DUF192 domain-containing protein [Thermoanaerobaculia bacterium]